MADSLHVMVVPSWFPTADSPLRGSFFMDHALSLKALGVQVGVVYPNLRSLRTILVAPWRNRFQLDWGRDPLPVLRWQAWNPFSQNLHRSWFVRSASMLAREYVSRYGAPDVIHAQSSIWGGLAARGIAHHLGKPFVVTEHSSAFLKGCIPTRSKSLLDQIFQSASAIICVSRHLGEAIQPFALNHPIKIIPNGVDVDFFRPLPDADRPSGPFRFLSVAHLTPGKGMKMLLRAFARAFHGDFSVVLEIGGTGSELGSLRKLSLELGIQAQVRFLGRLSRDEVRVAMQRANTFVLASQAETFGVVYIEAMATGVPIIATQCGGPEEIVTSDTGWMVPVGDEDALGAKLLQARMKCGEMNRTRIRETAVHHFSARAVASQYAELYRDVVAAGKLDTDRTTQPNEESM